MHNPKMFVCQKCRRPIPLEGFDNSHPLSSSDGSSTPLSPEETLERILDYASSVMDTDLPLCVDCSEVLWSQLQEDIKETTEEKRVYETFLAHLKSRGENSGALLSVDAYEGEVSRLDEETRQLREELDSLTSEKKTIEEEEHRIRREQGKLTLLEERYWQEYNAFQLEVGAWQEECDALRRASSMMTSHLEDLQQTSVIADMFSISHDGLFGTINGCRVGRLSSIVVDWNEINAGLGYMSLLLVVLTERAGVKLSHYTILPKGSFSKIVDEEATTYELYGGGGGFFWQTRFNKGLTAYLSCMHEFGCFLSAEDNSIHLPIIDESRIGGLSVKYSSASEEQWTRAMRHTLTYLKWLLLFVVRRQKEYNS